MNAIRFHVSCVPPKTNHHAKRIVRIGKFSRLADSPELVAAKGLLEELLIPHQPAETMLGPVTLVMQFTWPWLKSHSARVRALGRIPHISKPDLTNVAKTLEDRLVELCFIEDDRSVVDLRIRKWWGDSPGIDIAIAPFTIAPAIPLTPDRDLFSFAPME